MGEHRYTVGATVYLKRYPTIAFTVLSCGFSPARREPVYTIRMQDNPDNARDTVVWDVDLV